MDIFSNFQVALHYDAIGQLEQENNQYQQRAPNMQIPTEGNCVARFVVVFAATRWQENQNQADQQKHTACGRKLLDDRPEQRFCEVPGALKQCLSRFPVSDARGIEPVTGASIF